MMLDVNVTQRYMTSTMFNDGRRQRSPQRFSISTILATILNGINLTTMFVVNDPQRCSTMLYPNDSQRSRRQRFLQRCSTSTILNDARRQRCSAIPNDRRRQRSPTMVDVSDSQRCLTSTMFT
ncbi:unnamed protein product, partial [Ectocarpus sp. 13 AM-2016]